MVTVLDTADTMLFRRFSEGEYKAFDNLFLKYYPILCAYAKQYVSIEDAEEVVQETMTWLWENKKQKQIASLSKSYLFKSVKNKCLSLLSHYETKERIVASIHNCLQKNFDGEDFYDVEELAHNIDAALKRLPESYRQSFEMNRFQDMTYSEIAIKLNISPKTVDYRIQQALKLLRIELKEYLPLLVFLFDTKMT